MTSTFTETRRSVWHVVEWQAMLYRRIWKTNLFASLLQPLLYLFGMGLGVGALVNDNAGSQRTLGDISYVTFIAPGLIASTAMMLAANESMWPVLASFKWSKAYHAMAATPMGVTGIVLGQFAWIALRCLTAAGLVGVAMLAFADARSSGLPIAVLGATIGGLAFATPISALAVWRFDPSGRLFSSLQRFVITPMFLFGGTFYPVTQLPAWVRPIAYITPLWHTVELCRRATLHELGAAEALGHLAFLGLWIAGGTWASLRLFRRRLSE